jgi:hypothetical protein
MLGMLSSVVAASGSIEAGWHRTVRFIDRFKRRFVNWSRLAPQMPEWQCGQPPRNLERCVNRSAHGAGHVKYGRLPFICGTDVDLGGSIGRLRIPINSVIS